MNKLVRIILTEEEKALLKKLKDSITPETIEEWGRNQLLSKRTVKQAHAGGMVDSGTQQVQS